MRSGRGGVRVLDAYVRATHVLLCLAALLAPAMTLLDSVPSDGRALPTGLLVLFVGCGGALVLAAESAPERTPRWLLDPRRRLGFSLLVLTAAAGVLLLLPDPTAALPLALALRGIAGDSLWSGSTRILIAGGACLALGYAASAGWAATWQPAAIGLAAALALGVLVQDRLYAITLELDELRTREAERAVEAERRRFAGDLHDIQGRHLHLIVVEAELVGRLMASGRSADAAEHVERMRQAATEALDELHRVVHDYREVSGGEELAAAGRVLIAAGIAVDREGDAPRGLTPEQDRLLGLAVREAVTNVLKHSRALRCRIAVREESRGSVPGVLLTVEDPGPASANRSVHAGTGVRALQDRYRERGGELVLDLTRGARLSAWLPRQKPSPSDGARP